MRLLLLEKQNLGFRRYFYAVAILQFFASEEFELDEVR